MKPLLLLVVLGLLVMATACCPIIPSSETGDSAEIPAESTVEQAAEAGALTIVADEGAIEFTGYQINEARFNPSAENPAALNMMASLTFHNVSGERLEVRYPRFVLRINGVEWTELASTDFQIGRLQPDATQTIELQSLLLMRRITEAQQPVLEAIQRGEPVDMEIDGTIQVFPGGEETTLHATLTLTDIRLPGEWGAAD